MAEPTIQLGGGNWAGKTDNLLGYYKEGERFYKQDFTFSRSTTGTYTDSDGYIQEMPYNLLTYSEDFSNAAWLKTSGVTVTSNYGISPDGKQNSTRLQFASNNEQVYDGIVHSGNTETASIYVKGQSGITMQFGVGSNISQGSTYTLTGEWQRLEHQSTSGSLFIIGNKDLTATDIEIWGAQLVKGTSAKTYFPTTTRLNMPRVSYLNNSNGSLILEPQRSNLVTYSSDFSQWSISTEDTSTMTITPNYATAQNGLSASRLVATRPSTNFLSLIANYVTNSNTATKSVYIKNNNAGNVDINISDQAITVTDTWQRYEITNNYPHATIGLRYAGAALSCDISIAGFQFELGSYSTSYIPTSGSSVTRNADACSITNVADRIGQTEGTLYGEFDFKDHSTGTRRLLCLTDGTSTNRITTYVNTLDKLSVYIVNGGAAQADIQATILTEGIIKYAVAYANNSIKLYLNGTQVGTDTSATIPSTSDFLVGFEHSGSSSYFNWRNCQLYSTALTDSELATLTT